MKEIEKKAVEFENKLSSSALFKVFLEVARGQNYPTKIARKLKKSKAIVSRQLKQLTDAYLLKVEGEGVKQTYKVDWEVFTLYWIWSLSPIMSSGLDLYEEMKGFLERTKVPKWLGAMALTEYEWEIIQQKDPEKGLIEKLIPLTSNLAPIVEIVVKSCECNDFYDAFIYVSRSFAVGLPKIEDIKEKLDKIEDNKFREMMEVLYSDEVQLWFGLILLYLDYGANLVRNYILDKLGLLEVEE